MQPGNKQSSFRNISLDRGWRISSLARMLDRCRSGILGFALIFIALSLTLPVTAFCDTTARLPEAIDLLSDARKGGEYKKLPEEELAAVQYLFEQMLQGDRSRELFNSWDKLGFHILKAQLEGREVFALMEKPEQKLGRGFYLFPPVATGSTLLMMPHAFYDLHTRVIGQYLFGEGMFIAAAWNTVHRNRTPGKNHAIVPDDDPWRWDMADLSNTCFTALTRAFNRTQAHGHLIQLHGYSKAKRKSSSGRDSDLILSNGTELPPKELIVFGDCLKINLTAMVRVYPVETRDLGATENISARILNILGHNGFVQMEMSLPLRNQLRSSVNTRKALLNCIKSSWQ